MHLIICLYIVCLYREGGADIQEYLFIYRVVMKNFSIVLYLIYENTDIARDLGNLML